MDTFGDGIFESLYSQLLDAGRAALAHLRFLFALRADAEHDSPLLHCTFPIYPPPAPILYQIVWAIYRKYLAICPLSLCTLDTLETTEAGRGKTQGKRWKKMDEEGSRNPPRPTPRRVTPRLRPIVCDECAPPRPPPSFVCPGSCLRGRGVPSPCSVLCLCWACRVRVGCVGSSARVSDALTLRPGGAR